MKKPIIILVAILFSVASISQEKLTNESIIELMELGLTEDAIISKINFNDVHFDTSIEGIKLLKRKNVPPNIVSAMVHKSEFVDEGIFFAQNNVLTKIEPSCVSILKKRCVASMLIYDISVSKVKSYINNAHSANIVSANAPVFIFQFDKNNNKDLEKSSRCFKMASSPHDFILTKIKPKLKKDQRELVVGLVDSVDSTNQIAIDSENMISFSVEDLGNGKYKVTPDEKLAVGEYCFFYHGTIPIDENVNNQSIFDFLIQK